MEPFLLLLKIGAAIAIPKNAVHLDGLLATAIGRRWNISDYQEIHRTMKEYLAFDDDYGVFQCSAMTLVVTDNAGVTLKQRCRPDDYRNKMRSKYFAAGRTKKIRVNGGPTKNRMTIRPTHFSPFVAFSGVGHADAIKELLLNNIGGIGSDASTSAGGEIREITVISKPFSYIGADGLPVRNLPLAAKHDFTFDGLHDEPVTLVSPYYSAPLQSGFKPERVKVLHINSILGDI